MSDGPEAAPAHEGPLAEAARLDAQAIELGEESEQGRELRARAAALRVAWLGPRPYPVLVCGSCFRLTGWTTAAGECDLCARRAARLAAEHEEWPHPADVRSPDPANAPALEDRIAAFLGGRHRRDEAAARAWLEAVEPGETGPIDPLEGFELESAFRDEVERIEGAGMLVRFHTSTRRFVEGGWSRLPTSRVGRTLLPNPAEFAAELEVTVLVEAWTDYQAALAAVNRAHWRELEAARDAALARAEAREQALVEQAHTSELLDE